MKTIILACALGAGTPGWAADQTAQASAAVNSRPITAHLVQPFTPAQTAEKAKILRVGRLSSRPWTQVVGWHPGRMPSATESLRETHFNLFWIGAEPQP